MKKIWLLLSVLLVLLAGCTPAATPTPTSARVRIGYLVGDLHHVVYVVGQDAEAGGGKSFFEKYGVVVQDAPGAPYANGGVEMDHFAAGDVDLGYLGAPPAIIKHLNAGVKTTVVAQVNEIGSALIVAPGINRFSDLVGKTVATPGHVTIQFFLLRNYAQQQGVDISQINIVDVAPKDMRAKLESGAVAGYIAWEPYASDSVMAGIGKTLATSNDIWPHHLDCVLAVDQTFARDNPDTVVRFLKAHREATTWVQEALANPGSPQYRHLIDLAVKFTQRDAVVVEAAFKQIDFKVELSPTFRESFIAYVDKLIEFKVIGPDKLSQMGYRDTADFAARYIDLSFLEKAK